MNWEHQERKDGKGNRTNRWLRAGERDGRLRLPYGMLSESAVISLLGLFTGRLRVRPSVVRRGNGYGRTNDGLVYGLDYKDDGPVSSHKSRKTEVRRVI